MTFSKHTPGPWILMRHDSEEYDNQGQYKIWEPLEASGKEVITGEDSSLWEATVPDALLIAAAPDMYRELKELVTRYRVLVAEQSNGLTADVEGARAAIAKAEGLPND